MNTASRPRPAKKRVPRVNVATHSDQLSLAFDTRNEPSEYVAPVCIVVPYRDATTTESKTLPYHTFGSQRAPDPLITSTYFATMLVYLTHPSSTSLNWRDVTVMYQAFEIVVKVAEFLRMIAS